MTDTLSVSVIVPVFNGSRTIESCLESLLHQDYPRARVEILVVDNGSTDDTVARVKAFGDPIRLLSESVRGPAAARNRGVRESAANVIAFIDADCTAAADWLSHLVAPLEDLTVGIAGGRIRSLQPSNSIERFGERIHDHQKAIEVYTPPYAISMNWASPRRALLEADLFNESFIRCEDVDLSQRIHQLGYRLVYSHDALVYHRNERNLPGLFREGYQHGFWSVKTLQEHAGTNRDGGHRRVSWSGYKAIAANLGRVVTGDERLGSLCQATFDTGKKVGKIIGSVRFGYLEL